MKHLLLVLLTLILSQPILAQESAPIPKFYYGVSYGNSLSIGDFSDTDINNPDAGFAKNGGKLDLYGGMFSSERLTLTGTFRYQTFETEIEDLIETFNTENPGANFTGSTEEWKAFNLLVGLAYRVSVSSSFDIFPRFGLGPLIATNPGMTITSPNGSNTDYFARSSETGIGLGYELGIGLQTDLGRHFSLMPTFTFSGGLVTIPDVLTTTDNVSLTNDFQPKIQSFNFGLSLAYRFY